MFNSPSERKREENVANLSLALVSCRSDFLYPFPNSLLDVYAVRIVIVKCLPSALLQSLLFRAQNLLLIRF